MAPEAQAQRPAVPRGVNAGMSMAEPDDGGDFCIVCSACCGKPGSGREMESNIL